MSLATFEDANGWLDGSKISFANDFDAAPQAAQADALVKASLKEVYPTHVNNWIATLTVPAVPTEELSPALVRQIAAMLMAAYLYQKKYSEEALTPPTFALLLESRALNFLKQLRELSLTLAELDDPSSLQLQQADFWPNDTTLVEEDKPQIGLDVNDPLRFFTMDKVF